MALTPCASPSSPSAAHTPCTCVLHTRFFQRGAAFLPHFLTLPHTHQVDLKGVCGDSSSASLGGLLGWTDAFLDRILCNVNLVRDEVEHSCFVDRPMAKMPSTASPSLSICCSVYSSRPPHPSRNTHALSLRRSPITVTVRRRPVPPQRRPPPPGARPPRQLCSPSRRLPSSPRSATRPRAVCSPSCRASVNAGTARDGCWRDRS